MKRINVTFIFVMILLNTFAFFQIGLSHPDRMGPIIIFYICSLLPVFIKKVHPMIWFVYLIFIFLSQYFGSILNFYKQIWWYDSFMHCLSGFLTGYLAIYFLIIRNHFRKNDLFFQVVFTFCFILSIALFWEFLEYGTDVLLKLNTQHVLETGVQDTMEDTLSAAFGGILFLLCYSYETIYQKSGIIGSLTRYMK